MESFKSAPHLIACDAATIYSKLTNPSLVKAQIEAHADQIDDEARKHLDTVKFNENSIAIESPMGEVTLSLDPEQSIDGQRVVYTASMSPVANCWPAFPLTGSESPLLPLLGSSVHRFSHVVRILVWTFFPADRLQG